MDLPLFPTLWISISNLGRPMFDVFNALAASIFLDLDSISLRCITSPVESLSCIATIGLQLLELATSTTTIAPTSASLNVVSKLSLCQYSVLSFFILVNNVRHQKALLDIKWTTLPTYNAQRALKYSHLVSLQKYYDCIPTPHMKRAY